MARKIIYIAVYEGGCVAFSNLSHIDRYIETMDVLGEDIVLYDTDERIYEINVVRGGFLKPDFLRIINARGADASELNHLRSELKVYLAFLGEDVIDAHIFVLAKSLQTIQNNF